MATIVQIKQNRFENTILASPNFKIVDTTGGTAVYSNQDIYKYLNNRNISIHNTILKLSLAQRQSLSTNFNLIGTSYYRLDNNYLIDLQTYVGLNLDSYEELESIITYFSITDDVYTTLYTV